MDTHNPYVIQFKTVGERLRAVAAILPGDGANGPADRDIVAQLQNDGRFQRVFAYHPSYWALAHPLLFPLGDNGYAFDIPRQLGQGHDEAVERRVRTQVTLKDICWESCLYSTYSSLALGP